MGKRNYSFYGLFMGPTHELKCYKRLLPYRKAYKKARFKKAMARIS